MSKEIKISCSIQDRVSIDDLVPTQKNLKSLSKENFEKLRKSIIKNGFFFPIGIWDHDGVLKLLDGHQRLLTLKELRNEGYIVPLVPVFRVYASDEKQARDMLFHSVSQYGQVEKQGLYELMIEWDMKIDDLGSFELPISSLDIQSFDLEFFKDNKIEPGCDEDETPELPTESKVKRGDIFILGNHRLMCGDSTMLDDVEKLMNGEKADMVFTDPPYGMSAVSKSGVLKAKYGTDIMNDDNIDVAIDAYNLCSGLNISKMVFWGANYYSSKLPNSAAWLVWDKNNGGSDQMDCELAWTNLKGVTRQFTKASEKINRVHPTQKPVELAEWCFAKYEAKNILDLFGGSGSTLITCEKTDRKCYMMELDPKYCAVILDRWEKYSGKKAIHENGTSWESIKSS